MAGGTFQTFQIDARELAAISERYRQMGKAFTPVLTRTVNWTGRRASTQVNRTLSAAMGLPQKELRGFLQVFPARYADITYTIRGVGRPISLRAFGAVQRQKGVSARPWGERRLFRGTFIVDSLGGSVYVRTGVKARATKGKFKGQYREQIKKLWGPAVPREMAQHVTVRAFNATVTEHFPKRLEHEVQRAFARLRRP